MGVKAGKTEREAKDDPAGMLNQCFGFGQMIESRAPGIVFFLGWGSFLSFFLFLLSCWQVSGLGCASFVACSEERNNVGSRLRDSGGGWSMEEGKFDVLSLG